MFNVCEGRAVYLILVICIDASKERKRTDVNFKRCYTQNKLFSFLKNMSWLDFRSVLM